MASLASVLRKISQRETPTRSEKIRVQNIAKNIQDRLAHVLLRRNLDGKVLIQGSIAKDTWLRTHKDLDIFVLVSSEYSRDELGQKFLEAFKESIAPNPWVERWAEHPYLETFVNGLRVNIVPCYEVERGEWKSATDRTPYHTEYVVSHMVGENQKTEVRLLKRFMLGVDVYGADIKTGGFSGYLVELLILKYGSFQDTLKAATSWRNRPIIDIENYYGEHKDEVLVLFDEPLIVIDPVDKRRNVSSAVRKEKLDLFRVAAKSFLQTPRLEYFYPKTRSITINQLRKSLKNRATSILFLRTLHEKLVPDILWGQLYKSTRAVLNLLRQNEFNVLRYGTWSDESTTSVLLFELESHKLTSWKKHSGPPAASEGEEDFLKKYSKSKRAIAGPWLENGKWFVIVNRKTNDAMDLFTNQLQDGGASIGVARKIAAGLAKKKQILLNEEIMPLVKEKKEFRKYLSQFLSGKPTWLD